MATAPVRPRRGADPLKNFFEATGPWHGSGTPPLPTPLLRLLRSQRASVMLDGSVCGSGPQARTVGRPASHLPPPGPYPSPHPWGDSGRPGNRGHPAPYDKPWPVRGRPYCCSSSRDTRSARSRNTPPRPVPRSPSTVRAASPGVSGRARAAKHSMYNSYGVYVSPHPCDTVAIRSRSAADPDFAPISAPSTNCRRISPDKEPRLSAWTREKNRRDTAAGNDPGLSRLPNGGETFAIAADVAHRLRSMDAANRRLPGGYRRLHPPIVLSRRRWHGRAVCPPIACQAEGPRYSTPGYREPYPLPSRGL